MCLHFLFKIVTRARDYVELRLFTDKMISAHTMNTLTTRTSTNTDVTQSHAIVPEFRQVSDPDKCVVIGAPKLPELFVNFNYAYWTQIETADF